MIYQACYDKFNLAQSVSEWIEDVLFDFKSIKLCPKYSYSNYFASIVKWLEKKCNKWVNNKNIYITTKSSSIKIK